MNKATISTSLCVFFLLGCDTPSNNSGISITDNTDNEAYSVVMATNVVRSGEGSICTNGGVSIDTGIDLNGDGTLSADEVTDTYTICNGIDGTPGGATGPAGPKGDTGANGVSYLVEINEEDSGDGNCVFGGKRIEQGFDANNNETLESEEITETDYICAIYNVLVSSLTCKFAIAEGTGDTDIGQEIRAMYTLDTLYSGEIEVTGEVSSESISSSKTKRWAPSQSGWASGIVGLVFDVKGDANYGQWVFGVTRVSNVITTVDLYYTDPDNSTDPEDEVVLSTSLTVAQCNAQDD